MTEDVPVPAERINLVNFLESSPIKCTDIRDHTRRDPVLARVLRYCELGWPSPLKPKDTDLLPYFRKRDEMSIEGWLFTLGIKSSDSFA